MNFWIFTGGEKNNLFHQLMMDLEALENVTLISSLPAIPKKYQKIWKLHHNVRLNEKVTLPFRNVWYSYMPFDENVLKEGKHCLIFNNVSAGYFEPGLLKKWKKKYDIKLVFYFLDVYDSYYAKAARQFVKKVPLDAVYSFYQGDVEKYGFRYLDSYYSKLPDTGALSGNLTLKETVLKGSEKKQEKVSGIGGITDEESCNFRDRDEELHYDLFFWGTDGGRRPFIEGVADRLRELGLSAKIGICYTEGDTETSTGNIKIIYNKPLEYEEVIRNIQNCNVILDVVGDYSKGVSLRYYESMAYEKKLISNNPLVKKMRGYDPQRMLVIESPAEITKKFFGPSEIKKYENEFSPVRWIKELEEKFTNISRNKNIREEKKRQIVLTSKS